ncbi:MAG: hypothetical protein FJX57_02730 [Alphaproteobacteria bacterium]|nr:hypothetical protein [Alphaproteobacteria bacterium]
MLSAQERATIDEALTRERDRTFGVALPSRRVWIKRGRSGPNPVVHALHRAVAVLLVLPVLRPPRVVAGAAGLLDEARRLRRLARDGWPVPEVADVDSRRLVLADNGDSVADRLPGLDPAERATLLREAMAALLRLHAARAWHAAGQVRNFTIRAEGIGFIDFEDDIESAMDLPARQARDVALFLMSAARYQPSVAVLAAQARTGMSDAARTELDRVTRRAAPVRLLLERLAPRLGRDGRQLLALLRALDSTEGPIDR